MIGKIFLHVLPDNNFKNLILNGFVKRAKVVQIRESTD